MTGAQNTSKSMVNPVSTSSQQELQFGADLTSALNIIENQYVSKMALKKIPGNTGTDDSIFAS